MNRESALMRRIQMKASQLGARLFRNNTGAFKLPNGQFLRYGVCNPGGSDLIGWTATGRFLAVEVKIKTPLSKEQAIFLKEVIRAGGIAIVAYSEEDLNADALETNSRAEDQDPKWRRSDDY